MRFHPFVSRVVLPPASTTTSPFLSIRPSKRTASVRVVGRVRTILSLSLSPSLFLFLAVRVCACVSLVSLRVGWVWVEKGK